MLSRSRINAVVLHTGQTGSEHAIVPLTLRSTGRAGSYLLSGERRRAAPVTFNVRAHTNAR